MNDHETIDEQHLAEATNSSLNSPQQPSGTKIGKVSDFERDLIESEVIEASSQRSRHSFDESENEFEKHLNNNLKEYKEGDIVIARIRTIKKSGLLVDFSYKSDGFIPSAELSENAQSSLQEGDDIHAMVEKLETKEGYSLLSETKARAEMIWDDLFDIMNAKQVVTVYVKKATNRGYTVIYDQVIGFLHQEEGDSFKEKDSVQAVIIQVDKRRRKVLFSSRNIQSLLVKKEEVQQFIGQVNVGDVLTGTVSGIKKFGAFVNLGQVEGLVHISELSWRRIAHPSDILSVGDSVQVKVLAIDTDEMKLSLGMKQLTTDPWETIDQDLEIGQIVNGKVIRVIDFGVFVLLENDVEGLIHISEVSTKRISQLSSIFNVNDAIKVKVIKITKHDQKIGLSMKFVDQDNQDILNRLEAV